MARSAALGFTLGGVGAIAIISGIQGKSIAEVLRGEIGPAPEPAFGSNLQYGTEEGVTAASSAGKQGTVGSALASAAGVTKGLISPFPSGVPIEWGRSDQGVDGTTPAGTPLKAMGDGTVEIAHNPSGFGSSYPVLHISGDGSYYYGHAEPTVPNGKKVKKGEIIGRTHIAPVWGNSTTPGGFEIGKLGPHGEYPGMTAGALLRSFLQNLPRI